MMSWDFSNQAKAVTSRLNKITNASGSGRGAVGAHSLLQASAKPIRRMKLPSRRRLTAHAINRVSAHLPLEHVPTQQGTDTRQ